MLNGTAEKVGVGALLIGLGTAFGFALYWTFSPAERQRRLRVAEAIDHEREVRTTCRVKVAKAREDVEKARRGEITHSHHSHPEVE